MGYSVLRFFRSVEGIDRRAKNGQYNYRKKKMLGCYALVEVDASGITALGEGAILGVF